MSKADNTTSTFSFRTNRQTAVKIIDDPSKPGWEDFLSGDSLKEESDKKDGKKGKLKLK